jgi:ParB family chromosome partitioning protein
MMECQLHEYHPPLRELSGDEQERVDSLSDEGDALIRELRPNSRMARLEAEAASARLADIERELDTIEASRTMVDDAIKDQLGTFIHLAPDGSPRVHSRMFSERAIRQAGEDAEPEAPSGKVAASRLSATLVDELATQRRQILAPMSPRMPGSRSISRYS